MSETQNIMAPSQDNDKKQEKKGLKLAGYVIPWWVVIAVVLVLVYLAYDNHMLDFVCNPKKEIAFAPQAKGIPLPSLLPPAEMNQAVQVPQNLKNLFA
jgi:hypothetical protein